MIRKMHLSELDRIMDIWLETNISAHHFVEADYWRDNYAAVRPAIRDSEVYVYEENHRVYGFIGLVENYIAGLFVEEGSQSRGIGRELLKYVQEIKKCLMLHVYEKNRRAVDFYKKNGFTVVAENIDEVTGQVEYEMKWEK